MKRRLGNIRAPPSWPSPPVGEKVAAGRLRGKTAFSNLFYKAPRILFGCAFRRGLSAETSFFIMPSKYFYSPSTTLASIMFLHVAIGG